MCGYPKLLNAAPSRSRFTPATSLICLHAHCDSPGDKVKTGRRGNNASSSQFVLVGPRTGMLQSCG